MPITLRHTARGVLDTVWKPSRMPRIPDRNLNCCVFLYRTREDAEASQNVSGCGMMVAVSANDDGKPPYWNYAVSNRHIVEAAPVIRVNTVHGGTDTIERNPDEWTFAPGPDDLAATLVGWDESYDYTTESLERFADKAVVADHALGVGDEVFSIGLFVDFLGVAQNKPLARFGNVALMPEVPVQDRKGISRNSYIIEMRSRTGYSGSPVFIYIPVPQYEWIPRPPVQNIQERVMPWVLGIQWGQFPLEGSETVGTGMSTVVPAWRIKKFLLEDKRLIDERTMYAERLKQAAKANSLAAPTSLAPQSLAGDAPQSEAANPQHKEAFTSLLSAAVRTKPQAD